MSFKARASELLVGQRIKIGKKTATVIGARVVDVPVTRNVQTAVVEYKLDGEEGDEAIFTRHANATDKIEVVQDTPIKRYFMELFGMSKKPMKRAEKYDAVPRPVKAEDIPLLVKRTPK